MTVRSFHTNTATNRNFFTGLATTVIAVLIAGCSIEPECDSPLPIPKGATPDLTALSYNIGNDDTQDEHYALRMKDQDYEDFVAAEIRSISPDIVALQEVLPERTCESFVEGDPRLTCFDAPNRHAPVRRLLGEEYSIVCDSRLSVECIGVHVDFGVIRGVEKGSFETKGAKTLDLPYEECVYPDCDSDGRECDRESTVSTVIVDTDTGPIRVIHVHPTAIGNRCRQHQVRQAFELADEMDTVMLGDWNFDPSLGHNVVESSIWGRNVGKDRRFTDHTPRNGSCRAPATTVHRDANLDRVITDFASGMCEVLNEPAVDADFDFEGKDFRPIDHMAVLCDLHRGE